jgi:hypothetical protein
MVKIELESVEDTPIESSTWYDYITLTACLFVSVYIGVLTFIVISYRKVYVPLKAKNISNLTVINLAAILHIWATFVANDHIESLRAVKKWDCALWSYVLQYAIALNVWFIAILYRAASYTVLFTSKKPKNRKCFVNRRYIKGILVTTLTLPMLLLCIYIYTNRSSVSYSNEIGTCVSTIALKVVLLMWVAFGLLVLAVFTSIVHCTVDNKFFRESTEMKHICWTSIGVILLDAAINFSGLINFSMGRSLFTMGAVILHCVTSSKLSLHIAVRAVKRDYQLVNNVILELDPVNPEELGKRYGISTNVQYVGTADSAQIYADEAECAKFVLYCSRREKFRDDHCVMLGITNSAAFTPKVAGQLLLSIRKFKKEYNNKPMFLGGSSKKHTGIKLVGNDPTLEHSIHSSNMLSLLNRLETTEGFPKPLYNLVKQRVDTMVSYPDQMTDATFDYAERWLCLLFTFTTMKDYIKDRQGSIVTMDLDKDNLLSYFIQEGLIDESTIPKIPAFTPYGAGVFGEEEQHMKNPFDEESSFVGI